MNATDRKRFEQLLRLQRRWVLRGLVGLGPRGDPADDAPESSFPTHPADAVGRAVEGESATALAGVEAELLEDIDNALLRLHEAPEQFGICAACGKPIARERLELIPAALLCRSCQERAESSL